MSNYPAEAVKYIARPFVVVPNADGSFALFRGYAGDRAFLGDFTLAELGEYLTTDFALRRELTAEQRRKEQEKKEKITELDIEIDLSSLDLSSITL